MLALISGQKTGLTVQSLSFFLQNNVLESSHERNLIGTRMSVASRAVNGFLRSIIHEFISYSGEVFRTIPSSVILMHRLIGGCCVRDLTKTQYRMVKRRHDLASRSTTDCTVLSSFISFRTPGTDFHNFSSPRFLTPRMTELEEPLRYDSS